MNTNNKIDFWSTCTKPITGLAPMHDITTYLFRELQCRLIKPDVVYTEFVSAEGLSRVPEKFVNQLRYSNAQKPVVAQLFGSDPKSFVKAITIIHALGFDGVDINMGCPAPKVLKTGGGGALIGDYDKSDKIISIAAETCEKLNFPISVKTRIVLDNDKNREWFTFLSNYPLSAVAIHGRELKQEHHGQVDWDQVLTASEILKAKGIIVLGNGGIKNKIEGVELCNRYALDGYLIGQAAVGNPYVFSDNTLTSSVRKEIFNIMAKIITKEGNSYTLSAIKQFIYLTIKGWPNMTEFKQHVTCQKDLNKIISCNQTCG